MVRMGSKEGKAQGGAWHLGKPKGGLKKKDPAKQKQGDFCVVCGAVESCKCYAGLCAGADIPGRHIRRRYAENRNRMWPARMFSLAWNRPVPVCMKVMCDFKR